jgi:Tfp pilus assembly PilM family ATPase
MVEELGCAGARAVVIYHSTSSPTLVSSAPANLSSADAEEAARLALAGVADFPIDESTIQNCELFADCPASRGETDVRQSHVLSTAETATTINDISAWVESAGLKFHGAIPVAAVAMHSAANSAWSVGRRAGDRAAVLWVGEHGSALACVTEGSVRFVRPVGIGIESLIDAMCQPLRARDDSFTAKTLDRESARRLLAEVGVPAPEQPLPGMPGFTGAALLPVMQPALQRITIETKQSLRFGLPEKERASVRLLLAGPGAHVPGLGDWISRQCGLQQIDAGSAQAGSLSLSAATGAISCVLGARTALPLIQPERLVRSARRSKARAAIAIGVLVAGGWLAAEWYSTRSQLAFEQQRLRSLERAASSGQATARLQAATLAAKLALESTEARAARTLGAGADAAGTLRAISLAAPEAVRLGAIELVHDQSGIICRIGGHVRVSESDNPTAAITGFVDAITAIPLVRTARLGATQRTRIDGAQAQAFDLTVELVPIPAASRHSGASTPMASAKEES